MPNPSVNAQAINLHGVNTLTGTYTYNGGTLLISFTGSGWTQSAATLIGATLTVTANNINTTITSSVWSNEASSHKAFVSASSVIDRMPPNSKVTWKITAMAGTVIDVNDFFSIQIIEF